MGFEKQAMIAVVSIYGIGPAIDNARLDERTLYYEICNSGMWR